MKQKKEKLSGKSDESKAGSPKKRRLKLTILGVVVLALAICAGSVAFVLTKNQGRGQEQTAMRQNGQRQISDTVTEEGSVSVGTVSETFALDLSEYEGTASFSWGGGMNFNIVPGGSSMGAASMTASASQTRQLIVEEVYVTVGEEVKAGDPILKVTADSLADIRQGFSDDVTGAKEVYDQTLTQQKQTENEAAVALKENQLYGAYADTEYNMAVEELQEAVDALLESIEQEQESMAENQEELTALQETIAEQESVLESADYVVEYEDKKTNTYSWLVAVNAKVDIETTIETLEAEAETLEETIAGQEETLASLNAQLILAQKALETGTIEAESKRQSRQLALSSAQEIYDVTTELAAYDTENAKEDYEDAVEKLAELDSYIVDQVIYAQQDGVITAVSVSAGDTLQQDTELIALNSYDDVTITLTLDEDDMDAAALGSKAEVTFAAFPDEIFEGEVTEIGDAQIDSNTNTTTYQVVVSILENGSKLYEGMSAEVTFTRTAGAERGEAAGPEDASEQDGMSEPEDASGHGGASEPGNASEQDGASEPEEASELDKMTEPEEAQEGETHEAE